MRSRRHPNERLLVLAGLCVASALCLALEFLREAHFTDNAFRFLLWNLMLAWIPLVLALVVYDCYRRGVKLALLTPVFVLWLLFLPNAPYITTDFIHLQATTATPLWFTLCGVLFCHSTCRVSPVKAVSSPPLGRVPKSNGSNQSIPLAKTIP